MEREETQSDQRAGGKPIYSGRVSQGLGVTGVSDKSDNSCIGKKEEK